TLPQRLEFPFSLINFPAQHFADLSPAYNEIIPAWMLRENLYAVKRSEAKQRARNRARRHQLEYRVFRPELIDLLRDACRRLEAIPQVQDVYTDRDVAGLGKNFLLEPNRQQGVVSYRYFIRYYAFIALKGQLESILSSGNLAM